MNAYSSSSLREKKKIFLKFFAPLVNTIKLDIPDSTAQVTSFPMAPSSRQF